MKNKDISNKFLNDISKDYSKNMKSKIISNAVIKNGINNIAINRDSVIKMQHTFSEEIKTGVITNQKKSGRCWMFAGLNKIRYAMAQKLNLNIDEKEGFELSQAYLMFWDKLEKANYFLESIIETRREKINSRLLMWILNNAMIDGGQWDMFVNLVEKYGIIPKFVMPESYHSSDSALMNKILNLKLREFAKVLREDLKEQEEGDLRDRKKEMIKEFYALLCHFFGETPKVFDFEYRDKENDFYHDRNLTPLEFYKRYSPIKVSDYISIINSPTSDKPFGKTYTVKYLGNVKEGREVLYLNLKIDELKKLTISQLKDGETVWFGCDVGQMLDRKSGILDSDLYHYEEILDTSFQLSKADRLNYGDSCLTHAMVFTGVNILENGPNRWKVENSWGKENGKDGFFVMSDKWFDQFMYQVVVNKKHLSEGYLAALEKPPIKLEPWDPMGSLA
ncbi:MAG: aminopeptidase C [Atribacterota bacterium]